MREHPCCQLIDFLYTYHISNDNLYQSIVCDQVYIAYLMNYAYIHAFPPHTNTGFYFQSRYIPIHLYLD